MADAPPKIILPTRWDNYATVDSGTNGRFLQ